jgi:Sec-independent protein translocase protein TatA
MRRIPLIELFAILGIAVLLFSGKKLPEMVERLAEGIRNFRDFLGGGPGGSAAA